MRGARVRRTPKHVRPSALLALALLSVPGWAWAGPPTTSSSAQPSVDPPAIVLMVPELASDLDERALATIGAHLRDLDLRLVTERYDPDELDFRELVTRSRDPLERSDARGILWIDLPRDASSPPALYVLERDREQLYGRQIPSDLGEAVALETLANVAAMAAVALIEGRAIALDVPLPSEPLPSPEPVPVPEPEPPPRPTITREGRVVPVLRPWLRLRAGYRGNSFATNAPWQSSVTLAAGVRPHPRAHVELIYDVAPQTTLRHPDLVFVLQRFPFALAGGWSLPLRRGWDIELSGRLSVEPTRRISIESSDETRVELSGARVRWFSTAELSVAAGARLTESVRLSAGVGVAAMLTRADYAVELVTDQGTSTRRILAPHPVRALAWAGFDFDLVWR